MRTRVLIYITVISLSLVGCRTGEGKSTTGPDGSTSGGSDSGDVTGSDTGADDSGAGADDTATGSADGEVTAFSLVVHEGMGSILVANWTQKASLTTWVEYSFDDDVWLSSPPEVRDAGAAEELLLGIPFGVPVSARVAWSADGKDGATTPVDATTDALPDGAPLASSVEGDSEGWDAASPYVLGCIAGEFGQVDGSWSFITDRQGRTVWAVENDLARICLHTQVSHDGTQILIDQNSYWVIYDGGEFASIDRRDIEGNLLETYATPGLHHPFTEIGDGSIVWGAEGEGSMDMLMKMTPDGEVSTIFQCEEEHLGQGDYYCASNTIWWDEETDSFLYSIYSTDSILQVDHQSGTLIRAFGQIADAWAFDPEDSSFWWQHGVYFTGEGHLLVSSKVSRNGQETVVREYELDETNETLVEVWNFGEGEGVYGAEMGEADYTVGGNVLHNYGSTPRLREVTPEGEVVWDIEWDANYIGRTTPVTDLYAFKN